MHSRKKGKSGSKKPSKQSKPTWLRYNDKEIEQIILSAQVSEYTIQELALKNGMVTMAQDGLLKALDKITSVEEVFRVIE